MDERKNKLFYKRLVIFTTVIALSFSSFSVIPTIATDNDFLTSEHNINEKINNPSVLALSISDALEDGANYLVHAQADITEDNAGNGFDGSETPEDPDDGGWDWYSTIFTHSTSASPTNIYGATAQGLYYAYLKYPTTSYMTAMDDVAFQIDLDPGVDSIDSAGDLIWLMLYDDISSSPGYWDAIARSRYDTRISSYGSAQAFAEFVRDARGASYPNGIIPWDIAGFIKAAAMLDVRFPGNGYDTDADDMAEVLYQDSFADNPGYFDIIDDQGFDPLYGDVNFYWYTLGITGLIDAFDAAQVHTGEIPGLITILLDCQYPSGAFSYCYGANTDDEDWQSTAYAVLTLANYDQASYQLEINNACCWIASTQDSPSGGWVYSSGNHYPEVGGENIAALFFAEGPVKNIDTGEVFCTIQSAIDDADTLAGHTIEVSDGIYAETVTVNKNDLTIRGTSPPEITGGIIFASGVSGITIQNFKITGDAMSNSIMRSLGSNTDLTIDNCIIDGENVAGRFGYTGGQILGDLTITNCEFKDILGWAVFDTRSGSGGDGSAMDTIIFAGNYVHDVEGSIVFRGLSTDWTDIAYIYGNTFENIGDSGVSNSWAAFELNRAYNAEIYDNTIKNVEDGSWGEGQAMQLWQLGTVNIYQNTIENNYQGICILNWPSAWDTSNVMVYDNNFNGNNQYALNVDAGLTGVPVSATCNWWGDISGPSGIGSGTGDPVSTNVVYCPWLDAAYPGGNCYGGAVCWNQDTGEYFCCIQCAIDDSNTLDGHTIEVFAGTHYENVVVSKELTIISQSGAALTIIDAGGSSSTPNIEGIKITANNVNIDGFTVINGRGLWSAGIGVHKDVRGITIQNCIVHDCNDGISLYETGSGDINTIDNNIVYDMYDDSSGGAGIGIVVWGDSQGNDNVVITNNEIYSAARWGIGLGSDAMSDPCNDNVISGNNVHDNLFTGNGIGLVNAVDNMINGNTLSASQIGIGLNKGSTDNQITDNTISGNHLGVAIHTNSGYSSDSNTLEDNTISSNTYQGIHISGCSNNIAQGNTISGNQHGISLDQGSSNNYFTGNDISGNSLGVSLYTSSDGNTLDTNTISSNTWQGVLIDNSDSNIITGNSIESNWIGIALYNGANGNTIEYNTITLSTAINILVQTATDTTIYCNDISYAGGWAGIQFTAGATGTVHCNNIYNNNNPYGLTNDGATIDAECNWWGDFSGPYHATLNPSGLGDTVSDYVDFDPWVLVDADAGGPYIGGTITFDSSATQTSACCGAVVSYLWDFGDGTTSTGANPTHVYSNSGTYMVILTVTVTNNCGFTYVDTDITTATRYGGSDEEPPTTVIIYPTGGEILEGMVKVEWFVHDSQDEHSYDVPVYLYYSDESNVLHQIDGVLYNNDDVEFTGEYNWDTSSLPDGNYRLHLKAVDSDGNTGHDTSDYFKVKNNEEPTQNIAPDKPSKPSGPTSGRAGQEFTYSSSTSDPDGDKIWFMFDWGDGDNSGWLGPYDSGSSCEAKHTWEEKNTYSVKVKAKDAYGKESIWSDPLSISMPKNKPLFINSLIELLMERFPILYQILQRILQS